MKIAMPKEGDMLNQHFGRSKNFIIFTVENQQVVNRKEIGTENLQHNHAGLSGLMMAEEVSLIILGGIGQPALESLRSQGLDVVRGASGTCEEVLQRYLAGQLGDQNVTCQHEGEHHHH